jgi:hypothetical protein
MGYHISLPRQILNAMLRPFGWCVGCIVWAEGQPLPTGLRAYRLLRLRREGWGGDIEQDIGG